MNALNKLHESRSPHLRLLLFVTLLALTFAGGFAVAAHKTVTLTVDGTQMTVATMKTRVIDVITENGYDVGDRDDLYPAGDQPVHQSDTIVLRRSRPLQVSLDHPASLGPGVTSDAVGTELDWYMDWSVNDNVTLSFVAAYADPGAAIQQLSGRNDEFFYGMIFAAYSF